MIKMILIICLSASFGLIGIQNPTYRPLRVDSLFVKWNNATCQSIKRNLKIANDSFKKAMYKNRESAFEDYLSIKNWQDVNEKSIRFRFLDKIFSEIKNKPEYYIIEANNTGSVVRLRTFLIYPSTKGNIHIDIYFEDPSGWVKKIENKDFPYDIKDLADANIPKVAKGVNADDIIVTKIVNNQVVYSEYVLYGSLSASSGVMKIINASK